MFQMIQVYSILDMAWVIMPNIIRMQFNFELLFLVFGKKKLQKQLVYPNYKRKRALAHLYLKRNWVQKSSTNLGVLSTKFELLFLHFGTDSQKQLRKERTNWIFEEFCVQKKLNKFELLLCFLARGFVFLMLAALHWYCFWSSIHPLHSGAEWIMPFCLDSLCFFLLNWNWVLFVL